MDLMIAFRVLWLMGCASTQGHCLLISVPTRDTTDLLADLMNH